MKTIIFTTLLTFISISFCAQNKNYTIENEKVKQIRIKSDFTNLSIVKHNTNTFTPKSFVASAILPFVTGQIQEIPKYITKVLKRNKKKYTADYSAKNVVTFNTNQHILPKLTVERFINFGNKTGEPASRIILVPEIVQNKYFSFYVESANVNYSKAKLKNGYSHLVLLLEISITYDKLSKDKNVEKTEIKSTALKVPIDVKSLTNINSEINKNLSDIFPIENILEISVNVVETNPYRLKIEELESVLSDFDEPIADFFKKIGESLEKK